MFHSSSSFIAGVATNRSFNSLFITFMNSESGVAKQYSGDFNSLRPLQGNEIYHLPKDMPSGLRHGYQLIELIRQLEEFEITKQLALYSPGMFTADYVFSRFLEKKGIEYQDVTSIMNRSPINELSELSLIAIKSFDIAKRESSWIKSRNY